MIKVEYPFSQINSSISKKQFNDIYYDLIKGKVDEVKINKLLDPLKVAKSEKLTLEKILIADFHTLVEYSTIIEKSKIKKDLVNCFQVARDKKNISVYENAQGAISEFFMVKGLNMKSCHYCNIDYINVFEERYSYTSVEDFIINAPREVLLKMPEISEDTARSIRNVRTWNNVALQLRNLLGERVYKKISSLLNGDISRNLKHFNYKNITVLKNHFTLDHFLPKNDFQYFSLSLYNLVPSCNSCNCKFKGAMEFLPTAKLKALSPTSESYVLHKDLNFKLYFENTDGNVERALNKVNILNDFTVEIENRNLLEGFDTYLNMFKLRGRYEFHRHDALKLIKKRKDYSDSQIKEISNFLIENGIYKDEETIKVDLFGSIIFNDEEKNEPFAKYKRDIATQLGLIK